MPLAEIVNLTKHFGGLRAVDGLNFQIHEGEILGLIGPNGAGKTTVFNLISGVYAPSGGNIVYKGRVISGLKPHKIVQMGIVRTFQQTALFHGMTVLENLGIGGHISARVSLSETILSSNALKKKMEGLMEHSMKVLTMMGLERFKDELPANLPYGYQRILGVAIALASNPTLLLLDEPVTGMNPEETAGMMKLVQSVRSSGVTILLVEHDMKMVMGICDRIVAISFGRKLAEGTPEEVRNNEGVIKAYLGGR
jgi:branched-chain amino acid transport system ATP-binding protein